MVTFLLINTLLAIIPAIALILYFYRKDSQKREPILLIWKLFIIGFFSVIPAAVIELFLEPMTMLSGYYQSLFARAFIIAGLVEEGTKFLVVMIYIYKKSEFDEITDGIVYTIAASMGFACFENILYSSGGLSIVLLRGITAVPLHAVASGIMGYYMGITKFETARRNTLIKGLLAAVLIHGLYDFLLFTNSILGFLVIPMLIISWRVLRRMYKDALRQDRMCGRS